MALLLGSERGCESNPTNPPHDRTPHLALTPADRAWAAGVGGFTVEEIIRAAELLGSAPGGGGCGGGWGSIAKPIYACMSWHGTT